MKINKLLLSTITILILISGTIAAHPGNTDSNGGHWDRENGTYHYHIKEDELDVYEHFSAGHKVGYKKGIEEAQADYYDKGYDEGYSDAEKEFKPPENAFLKIIYKIGDFINRYFLMILLFIIAVSIFCSVILNHIRKIKSFRTELDCKGIARFKIKVNEVQRNNTFYTNTAEVMVYTKIKYCRNRYGTEEIENTSTHFFLHHFTWPNGQEIYLHKKTENGNYTHPEVHFNKPTTLYTGDNKEYTVILLEEITKLSGEQIKELHKEKEKIRRKEERVKKNIDRLLDDKTYQHKFFSNLFADYRFNVRMEIANNLCKKPHPAYKAAEKVKQLSKDLEKSEKAYKNLKYKLEMYGIEKIDDITLEDAKYLQSAQELLKSKNND